MKLNTLEKLYLCMEYETPEIKMDEAMRVAVAGGTGVVGRHVVESVRTAGHEPVVLSRSRGVDLVSGRGLTARLDGAVDMVPGGSIFLSPQLNQLHRFDAAGRRIAA